MNRKGFTLTELLATLVILGIIAVISVPVYNNQVTKSRIRVYETYKANLKDKTNTFVLNCISKNRCDDGNAVDYYEDYANGVRVDDLVTYNYITELKDPAGNGTCSGSVYVGNKDDQNRQKNLEYNYEVCLVCGDYESEECKNFSAVTTTINGGSSTYIDSTGNLVSKEGKVYFTIDGYSDLLEISGYRENNNNIKITCTRLSSNKNQANCNTNSSQSTDFTIKTSHKLTKKVTEKKVIIDNESPSINDSTELIGSGEDEWRKKKKLVLTISDNYKDSKNVLKYSTDGKTWTNVASSGKFEKEFTENGSFTFSVKDAAGNKVDSDYNMTKISSTSPSISVEVDSAIAKSHDITIAIENPAGISLTSEYKYFLSKSQNPKSIPALSSYNPGTKFTVGGAGYDGDYYLFVKPIKDKAYNESVGGEDSGVGYHRFGVLKFDNTGPSGCSISLSNTGKTPYVELTASGGSSDLAGYSWINTTDGTKYSKNNTKNTVYANGSYSIYARDIYGNKSTCKTVSVSNIDGTAPQISYTYDGNHNGNCYYSSAKITAKATSSTVNLTKFERWTNGNTSQNYNLKNNVNAKTFSDLLSLSSTGSYYMTSKATIVLPNSNKIESTVNSNTITIDASAPYTPYLSVSQNNNGLIYKSRFKVNGCGSGSSSCSIEYLDYCVGGDNSLSFTISANDNGCSGISTIQFSTDGNNWNNDPSGSLRSVVSDLNSGCKIKDKTVYLRAVDKTGRTSGNLPVTIKRHVG